MNLEDAFVQFLIESGYPVLLSELMGYAQEDQHGGRDTGEYPIEVSINQDEGRFLYALIRLLKPERSIEIGCADGCSAVHMLEALRKNEFGELVSFDINPNSGRMVTNELRDRWQLVIGDATVYPLPSADFIFEDGDHSYLSTRIILEELKLLNPKIIVSHDYFRHIYDPNVGVKQAFDEVFPDGFSIWFSGTKTGLGIWVNPNRTLR